MFFIKFTDEPLEYPNEDTSIPAAPGMLRLGRTIEEFLANLQWWGKRDYESHWIRELNTLCQGRSKIALVVSYNDPKESYNLEIWCVYREGEWAHFQNQLPFYSNLPSEFEISKMSDYIDDRRTVDEEGNRISEWTVAMRDIETFLYRSGALQSGGSVIV